MFIYTVKSGDSLYLISGKFQVSSDTIRSVNGLIEANLVPGQALIIPSIIYIVQSGDTLVYISNISYIPIELLRTTNGMQNDFIYIGMRLYLPPRPKYLEEGLSYLLPSTRNKFSIQLKTLQC